MKAMTKLLFRPWILGSLGLGSFLISISFSVRFYRAEIPKVEKLTSNLQEMRLLRQQVQSPAKGLPLLSETGSSSPYRGISDPTLGHVTIVDPVSRTPLGFGLERVKTVVGFDGLSASSLGDLFVSLEGQDRGWWITEVNLETSDSGLKGQVQVEALDNASPDA